jgi:hypothetical protein
VDLVYALTNLPVLTLPPPNGTAIAATLASHFGEPTMKEAAGSLLSDVAAALRWLGCGIVPATDAAAAHRPPTTATRTEPPAVSLAVIKIEVTLGS